MPPIQEGLLSAYERRSSLIASQMAAILTAARSNRTTEVTKQFVTDNTHVGFEFRHGTLTRLMQYEHRTKPSVPDKNQLFNQVVEDIGSRATLVLELESRKLTEVPSVSPEEFARAA